MMTVFVESSYSIQEGFEENNNLKCVPKKTEHYRMKSKIR